MTFLCLYKKDACTQGSQLMDRKLWIWTTYHTCYVLQDLVPYVQFNNMKNNHVGVLLLVKLQAFFSQEPSIFSFLNCYLAAHGQLRAILKGTPSLTRFYLFRAEGHREPRNEVGSLSPVKRLVGFEPGTLRF